MFVIIMCGNTRRTLTRINDGQTRVSTQSLVVRNTFEQICAEVLTGVLLHYVLCLHNVTDCSAGVAPERGLLLIIFSLSIC